MVSRDRGRRREGEKQSEKGSAHVVATVQHATVLCNRIVANENDRVYYYSADWATGLLRRDYHRPSRLQKSLACGEGTPRNMHKITELITSKLGGQGGGACWEGGKVVTRLQCKIYVASECKSFRYATLTTAPAKSSTEWVSASSTSTSTSTWTPNCSSNYDSLWLSIAPSNPT